MIILGNNDDGKAMGAPILDQNPMMAVDFTRVMLGDVDDAETVWEALKQASSRGVSTVTGTASISSAATDVEDTAPAEEEGHTYRIETRNTVFRHCLICRKPITAPTHVTARIGCQFWRLHCECARQAGTKLIVAAGA